MRARISHVRIRSMDRGTARLVQHCGIASQDRSRRPADLSFTPQPFGFRACVSAMAVAAGVDRAAFLAVYKKLKDDVLSESVSFQHTPESRQWVESVSHGLEAD